MKAHYVLLFLIPLLSSFSYAKMITVINQLYTPIKVMISHKDFARDKLEYEEAIIKPGQPYQFKGHSFFSIKWYYNGVRCYANIPTSIPTFDGEKKFFFNGEINLLGNSYTINFDEKGIVSPAKKCDSLCHYIGEEHYITDDENNNNNKKEDKSSPKESRNS